MDLQTRKLNLITYLAQLQDELFFEKIEHYILKKRAEETQEVYQSFTNQELVDRIKKSEQDFKNGKVISQEELDNDSADW